MKIEVGDVGNEQMPQGLYVADLIKLYWSQKEAFTKMSVENFLKLMEKECSKEGKYYKLPLPLRLPNKLSTNKRMAETRLKNHKERFIRDKQFLEDYARFMEDMISQASWTE